MRLARLAFVTLFSFGMAATTYGEDTWDYPSGRNGVNQVAAGRAGQLRVFDCQTTDSVETVVLWYAKRLGLKDDHRLSVSASKGFDKLENDTDFNYGFGHDTDNRRDHTQMMAHVTPSHAHVTFLHRPDFKRPSSVTISIAESPNGTSVHVIQPTVIAVEKTSKRGGQTDNLSRTK